MPFIAKDVGSSWEKLLHSFQAFFFFFSVIIEAESIALQDHNIDIFAETIRIVDTLSPSEIPIWLSINVALLVVHYTYIYCV